MDKLVCPCVTTQMWAISWVEVRNQTKAFELLALPACPGQEDNIYEYTYR